MAHVFHVLIYVSLFLKAVNEPAQPKLSRSSESSKSEWVPHNSPTRQPYYLDASGWQVRTSHFQVKTQLKNRFNQFLIKWAYPKKNFQMNHDMLNFYCQTRCRYADGHQENDWKRKFTIRVEKAVEGGYTDQCIELPGAISEGDTIEELKTSMTEAIQLVLDTLEQKTKKDKKIVIEIPS